MNMISGTPVYTPCHEVPLRKDAEAIEAKMSEPGA